MVNPRARRMALGLAVILSAGLLAGMGRLVVLHGESGHGLARQAEARTRRLERLPARRGDLRDRHGRLLATDVSTLRAEVLPRNVKNRRESPGDKARLVRDLAAWLSPRVDAPVDELERRLAGDRWSPLGRPVSDPDLIEELEAERSSRLYGLDLVPGTTRRYPWGTTAGNLVGFVDHQGRGVAGLEQGLQEMLVGSDGAREVHVGTHGRRLVEPDSALVQPLHGLDVTLTIDIVLQQMVEQELVIVRDAQQARRVFAVLLDAKTSEILALASVPGLDPEASDQRSGPAVVLGPVQEVYPPGSTFKPLMMATALQLGIVRPDQLIDCREENGRYKGRRVKDTHAQDRLMTPEEVLIHSSNIGMASIFTSLVSPENPRDQQAMAPVHAALLRLGFGAPLGLPLPAESPGKVTALKDWHRTWTLTSVSFGQEISLTAVQMAAAVNTLVDGTWRRPELVVRLAESDGTEVSPERESPRPVFAREHAARVRAWMERVVAEGSCKEMRELGVPVAGKTGTADSEVDLSREIHSYVALAPADDPLVTLVVVVAEPRHARYSSESAAPTAGRILRRVLPYLGQPLP